MRSRTTHATITFAHPFRLKGFDRPQGPGTYSVRTDEELIEGLSFPAYGRTATEISIPVSNAGSGSVQLIATDPRELEAAFAADRARTVELAGVPARPDAPTLLDAPTPDRQARSGRRFGWPLRLPVEPGRPGQSASKAPQPRPNLVPFCAIYISALTVGVVFAWMSGRLVEGAFGSAGAPAFVLLTLVAAALARPLAKRFAPKSGPVHPLSPVEGERQLVRTNKET
jgi:hypothetical protein